MGIIQKNNASIDILPVLHAAEIAAYHWLTAGFSEESNLNIELTGWQPDPDTLGGAGDDDDNSTQDLQYLVKIDLTDEEGGVTSEVFLVLSDNAGVSWYAEYHCEAGGFEPDSWREVPNK